MRILKQPEFGQMEYLMRIEALQYAAQQSRCLKAACGALIVDGLEIISKGANGPAGDEPCRCQDEYQLLINNRHDLTCCMHAEWRAIISALKVKAFRLPISKLLFVRLTSDKKRLAICDNIYCTVCSRMILDCKIKEVILLQSQGLTAYTAQEFNDLSFKYYKNN